MPNNQLCNVKVYIEHNKVFTQNVIINLVIMYKMLYQFIGKYFGNLGWTFNSNRQYCSA